MRKLQHRGKLGKFFRGEKLSNFWNDTDLSEEEDLILLSDVKEEKVKSKKQVIKKLDTSSEQGKFFEVINNKNAPFGLKFSKSTCTFFVKNKHCLAAPISSPEVKETRCPPVFFLLLG